MSPAPRTAIVIGGGVAGLWTALALARRDVEVTLLERKEPGAGASHGNGGWVSPPQAGPLPEPGLIGYGMRSLIDRESALYFAPRQLPLMSLWLAAFARRCTKSAFERGVLAMSKLGYPSFDLVQDLVRQISPPPRLDRSGFVVAAAEPEPVRAFIESMAPLREQGHDVPTELLSPDELAELEPNLAGRASAAHLADHWQVDPAPFVAALAAHAEGQGVRIVRNAPVSGFATASGRITAVHAAGGVHRADAVVLAAGAWTKPLARKLGVHLPIAGGKGYSVDLREPDWTPNHALMFMDTHLAIAPLGDRVRVAGTMEFSGLNEWIDERRVAVILRDARELFGGWRSADPPWAGLRPVAPDGLPVIGRLPRYENAFTAGAYSMLGMTISPAAGDLLAEQITSGREPDALKPFRPSRFLPLALPRQ